MKARSRLKSERPVTVRVRLGRPGSAVQELKVPSDSTVKDVVLAQKLEELSIRINGHPVRLSGRLKDGDLIVALPRFIVGSSAARHDHLNLDECRRTMSPRDFDFFVNFVGADRLGFSDEDLEPC